MAIHTSDGDIHENEWDFLKSQIFDPRNAAPPQEDINKVFDDQSNTLDPNGNPLGSSRKPTGALESEIGTKVAWQHPDGFGSEETWRNIGTDKLKKAFSPMPFLDETFGPYDDSPTKEAKWREEDKRLYTGQGVTKGYLELESKQMEEDLKEMGSRMDDGTAKYGINNSRDGARKISFDTPLNDKEETQFQAWKQKNAPNDSGMDYDLRGAFKAGVTPDEKGHMPDTWKKPNHPTFSDQSQYAPYGNPGKWDGETYIPPTNPAAPEAADVKKMADKLGQGADLQGSYLPDSWHTLTDAEKAQAQTAHPNTTSVYEDDYKTADDIKKLVDKHGSIEVYPGDPSKDSPVFQFLREADPNKYLRYNFNGDKNGSRTINIRKREDLVSDSGEFKVAGIQKDEVGTSNPTDTVSKSFETVHHIYDWMVGNKDKPPEDLEKNFLKSFPSKADAEEAIKNGFGYASKTDGVIGGSQGIRTLEAKATDYGDLDYLFERIDSKTATYLAKNPDKQIEFTRAALAVNRNPIAMLGFDPKHMTLSNDNPDTITTLGAYSKDKDAIWSTDAANMVHESLHRGLEQLRKKDPEAKVLLKELPEEYLVRYMMYRYAGDPESLRDGNVSQLQRSNAIKYFDPKKAKIAEGLMDRAAKLVNDGSVKSAK